MSNEMNIFDRLRGSGYFEESTVIHDGIEWSIFETTLGGSLKIAIAHDGKCTYYAMSDNGIIRFLNKTDDNELDDEEYESDDPIRVFSYHLIREMAKLPWYDLCHPSHPFAKLNH